MRRLAWNGISLSVPGDWRPADVEHHFLSLARHGRIMLECAWRPDPAEFSTPRRRAALERQNRRQPGFTADPRRVPARWAQVLAALRPRLAYVPFAWLGGCGALCHDAAARCSIEVRFLLAPSPRTEGMDTPGPDASSPDAIGPDPISPDAANSLRRGRAPAAPAVSRLHAPEPDEAALLQAATVLTTLRLHSGREAMPFRLHDLGLDVPPGFTLRDFTFRPGLCALHFRRDADTLTVERLSPANVVLQGVPLRHWAARRAGVDTGEVRSRLPHCQPPRAKEAAAWQRVLRRPLLGALPVIGRLARGDMHETGAAWLVADENKLVSVCLRSAGQPAPATLAALCASLHVLDTE
ncbi:hypothetical protein [Nitratidesulfovibrio sp. HK-II]|uniref:hypothetical protein n=1 Tax=Nitratidesulfovibrio sp. HK-II TaxID=2009266 RepID=UPI000EE58320|nr:hypothetical protein [Nitratidesulfovibrio sp. HK-II]GBO96741.1 hypothetical protein RVX_1780 [Nitratidesulfovibrio sp. HK-II]